MSIARYFIFTLIGLLALLGVAAFIYELLPSSRQLLGKPIGNGGIDSCTSLFGLLGFLGGVGLVVYDRDRYAGLGMVIAITGFMVVGVVVFLRQRDQ